MKKSIANKIEALLAKMTSSETVKQEERQPAAIERGSKRRQFGKFCRSLPVTLFNLIRPAQQFNYRQDV